MTEPEKSIAENQSYMAYHNICVESTEAVMVSELPPLSTDMSSDAPAMFPSIPSATTSAVLRAPDAAVVTPFLSSTDASLSHLLVSSAAITFPSGAEDRAPPSGGADSTGSVGT